LKCGGAERVQLELLRHLHRSAIQLTVVYLNDRGDLHSLVPSDVRPLFATEGQVSLKARAIQIAVVLLRLAARCDVIFAMQEGTPIYLGVLVAKMTGRCIVAWQHTSASADAMGLPLWSRVAMRVLYPRVDRFIGVSRGVTDALVDARLASRDRAVTLPNPLTGNIRQLAAEPVPSWAEEVFRAPTILAVARIEYLKRLDLLLRAVHQVQMAGEHVNLLIIGEGRLRESMERLARELGIADSVFIRGFELNPYPFFRRATALAVTSEHEGLGMAMVEALALGLPVVAFDAPSGPREILCGGRYGVLVRAGDVGAFAAALGSVVRDSALRSRLSREGAERAREFDSGTASRLFAAELQRAVNEG
jgi:glycosyltransferase involved in cell wall biosynthesis